MTKQMRDFLKLSFLSAPGTTYIDLVFRTGFKPVRLGQDRKYPGPCGHLGPEICFRVFAIYFLGFKIAGLSSSSMNDA